MNLTARDGLLDCVLTAAVVAVLCVPYLVIACPLMWLADHAKGISE